MNRLVSMNAMQMGKAYELKSRAVTIGKAGYNSVVLSDPSIADEHCSLVWRPTGWVVKDLGGPAGTFVNGKRVVKEAPVKAGDTLKIGGVQMRIELDGQDPQGRGQEAKPGAGDMKKQPGPAAAAPPVKSVEAPAGHAPQADMAGVDDYMKMLKSGRLSPLKRNPPPPPGKPK